MTSRVATAVYVERRKNTASRVVLATSVLIVVGIAVIATSLTMAADAGNAQIVAQLGDLAHTTGWEQLTGVAAQVSATGAVLGFGVALSWMFGREFADGTISSLFALPVSLRLSAMGKLIVYAGWAAGIAIGVVVVLGIAGVALGFGLPDVDIATALIRQWVLIVASAAIALPAAWASTVGRGLLPGIAATVGIVATAQVIAISGVGAWFPFAAAALWALSPEAVSGVQLSLIAVIPAIFGILTMIAWARLQLDR